MTALALVTARCGRVTLTVAFWVLVVVVAGVGLMARAAPLAERELLAVRSGSMAPAIPTGAMVAVDTSGARAPQPGDAIAFLLPGGQAVVHRVVAVNGAGEGFVTQGDANDAPDPWPVAREHVIGTVTWQLPGAGYVLAMLGMLSGIVAILALAGSLLCAAWLLEDLEGELAALVAPSPGPAAGPTPARWTWTKGASRAPSLGHSARRLR